MRALLGLTAAVVLRLLREGLVVRALAWPGVLPVLTMFMVGSVTAMVGTAPSIVVDRSDLVVALESEGFVVTVDPEAESMLRSGLANRAIWREEERWVLGSVWGGRTDMKAEAVLRDFTGEPWRIDIPSDQSRRRDVGAYTPRLAGVIGVLFTLYGVVIGAGALYRDRAAGSLETDLALAVPRWMHAAARMLALALVLAPTLTVSLLVVDAMTPIAGVGWWIFSSAVAAVTGGVFGLTMMARADAAQGFSSPLSRALTATTALLGFGWWWPDVGRLLPVASLGSSMAGARASAVIIPLLLFALLVAIRDFHRSDNL